MGSFDLLAKSDGFQKYRVLRFFCMLWLFEIAGVESLGI
jgi:hypothetical protein